MKNNLQLQKDVQNAIKWEPSMNAAEIGVTAKDGVVTLSGMVDSYSKKLNAENATKNVEGVKAVAVDMTIHFDPSINKNDADIANDVLDAWKMNWEVPKDRIKVKVENGWVELEGEVLYNYQKQASQTAIKNLSGVKGVTNHISVKMQSKEVLEQKSVENALKRNWSINSNKVNVEVTGNNVKLTGIVGSLYQKEEAGRLTWNAPGVQSVDNELAVI
jgi:osmotically-inducible protein OsmY